MKVTYRLLALLAILTAAIPARAVPEPAAVTLRVAPERSAVHLASSRDVILQIEVQAGAAPRKSRLPLNLGLVLDRSGSMEGAKLEKARQAACVAVDQLAENDFFSLVIYDDEAQALVPPQKVTDRKALKAKINAIEPGGSTALYDGVKTGVAQLRDVSGGSERVSRIVLLSDGLANVGPSSPRDLAKLGKKLAKEDISVSTIGLGDDYNEDLMTALAEASRANYYYVRDAEKLPGIFKEELGAAQSIVARKVEIILRLGKGIQVREILGESEISCEGSTIRIPVEDLAGGQKRRFHVVCRLPEALAESKATEEKLGDVQLEYDRVEPGRREQATALANVRIAADQKEADAAVVADVAANVAITRNRLAKEKAIALADEGRSEEAVQILQRQAAANASLPATAKSSLLDAETENLTQSAGKLKAAGSFDKGERKKLQLENYQDRKQKR